MKTIFFFIFAFMLQVGVYAQTNINQSAERRAENLDALVNMTDAQENEVYQINVTKLTEIQNLLNQENYTGVRQAHRARRNLIMDVLTEGQVTLLKNAITERHALATRDNI